jgi:hypothetical protein
MRGMVTGKATGEQMRWNFGDSRDRFLSLDEYLAQQEEGGFSFFAGKEPGYRGDSTPDSNSAAGIGDHSNRLIAGLSVALTKSEREALFGTSGRSTGKMFTGPDGQTYRDDDTAPEGDTRIDRYSPGLTEAQANGRGRSIRDGLSGGSTAGGSHTFHLNFNGDMGGAGEDFAADVLDVLQNELPQLLEQIEDSMASRQAIV